MKLALTLLVRDEIDIVRANVEHHLAQGVDVLIVMDNGSIDGTREVLLEYVRGGNVVLLDEPRDDYDQWRWVTRMARLAAGEHKADWIVHADADEFWWPDERDLKSILADVPAEAGWLIARRQNMLPSAVEQGPFFDRMVIRDRSSYNAMARPLLGKICHRPDGDVWIAQGNHELHSEKLRLHEIVPPITIMHFPMRSYPQFERKVVLGGRAYARNTELEWSIGDGWRSLYQQYLDGDLAAWYGAQVPTPAQVTYGLGTGRYVVDRRLKDFMHGTGAADASPERAEAAPADRPRRPAEAPRAVDDGPAGLEVLLQAPAAGLDAGLEARLVEFVDGAEQSLVCAAVELRSTAVAAALHHAQRRGVLVHLLQGPASAHDSLAGWRLAARTAAHAHSFVVRDCSSVWTGSAELTPEGLHGQANDCATVYSRTIASGYLEAYRSRGVSTEPVPLDQGDVRALFTPGDAVHDLVVEALGDARRARIVTAELPDAAILTALRECNDRGVDLAGIFDPERIAAVLQEGPREPSALWFLADDRFVAAPPGSVGNRFLVVDDALVVTGSAAFAGRDLAADALVLRSPQVAAAYLAYFDAVTSSCANAASPAAVAPST